MSIPVQKRMARPVCKSFIFDDIFWSASTYTAYRPQAVAKVEIRKSWSHKSHGVVTPFFVSGFRNAGSTVRPSF